MITVLEVLNKSAEFLKAKDVPNPRFDAECLLGKVMQCARLDLYLKFDHPLAEPHLTQMREYIARRAKREPLQFILETVPFWNLKLEVKPHTLIPRPETEEFIEHLVDLTKEKNTSSTSEVSTISSPASATSSPLASSTPTTILDLGTGTGAIALALASSLPNTQVTAVDISTESLALAQSNAHKNNLQDRVQFLNSNWFEAIPADAKFDWIIANPPYLTEEEYQTAAPEVKQHEPKSALVATNEGLADLFIILEGALPHLNSNGLVALETGIHQHQQLAQKAQQLGYTNSQSLKDLTHRERFFFAWK